MTKVLRAGAPSLLYIPPTGSGLTSWSARRPALASASAQRHGLACRRRWRYIPANDTAAGDAMASSARPVLESSGASIEARGGKRNQTRQKTSKRRLAATTEVDRQLNSQQSQHDFAGNGLLQHIPHSLIGAKEHEEPVAGFAGRRRRIHSS